MVFGQPSPMTSSTEEIIFEDNFANDIYMKYVDESTGIDLFAEMERDEKTYLDDLQSITSKIDLPIDDFVASIENADDIIEETLNLGNIKSEQLLMEFNSILDAVELQNQLTPPQTPPYVPGLQELHQINTNIPTPSQPDQYQIFNYQQAQPSLEDQFIYVHHDEAAVETPESDYTVIYENTNESMISSEDVSCQEIIFDPESIISSPVNIERELEVVDELVRAHSRQITDYDDNTSNSASSVWSPRSEYSSSGYSQYDDEPVKKSSGLRGVTKKRSRGYGRNPEEKKSRKKEQNKNAATRYRIKKKQEVEVILDEEKILMDKNRKLTTTYKDTKREVKYLKSLLRDLFKARGFI